MDKTRLAVRRPGPGQEMLEPFQRNLLALRVPAHLGRLGKAVDLPGLHERSPRREPVGAAFRIEAIDKAAAGAVPTLAGPQRQGALDDEALERSDDIAGL